MSSLVLCIFNGLLLFFWGGGSGEQQGTKANIGKI